jgi:hypothetical protein
MKKITFTPDALVLGGLVICWLMYMVGKINGLMMGGDYTFSEALNQSFDNIAFVPIALWVVLAISSFIKRKRVDK